jgi:hypothetical protein
MLEVGRIPRQRVLTVLEDLDAPLLEQLHRPKSHQMMLQPMQKAYPAAQVDMLESSKDMTKKKLS